MLAAGGAVALLDTIREIAGLLGLDEAGAMAIYVPLLEQAVANARALGISAALTGPLRAATSGRSRRTSRRCGRARPDALAVYRALLARDADDRQRSVAHCHQRLLNISGPHLQASR